MKTGKFYSKIACRYIIYTSEKGLLTYKSDFVCERTIELDVDYGFSAKELYKIIEFDVKYNN